MGEDGAGGARFLTDSITQDFLKGQYQEIFIEVFFFLELYFTVRGSRSYFWKSLPHWCSRYITTPVTKVWIIILYSIQDSYFLYQFQIFIHGSQCSIQRDFISSERKLVKKIFPRIINTGGPFVGNINSIRKHFFYFVKLLSILKQFQGKENLILRSTWEQWFMGNASSQKYRDFDPLKVASEIISMVLDAGHKNVPL